MESSSNLRRLALARFLSLAGSDGAFFVGLWGRAVYEFGADPAGVAPLLLAFGVASLVGATAGGPLVDRYDPRRVLLAGELLAVPAALALLLPSTLGGLAAVVTVRAFTQGVVGTAEQSFGPFLATGAPGLGRVNASLEVAASSALVAGAAIAAVLSGTAGVGWVFVLDAATSLAAVLLVAGVAVRRVEVAREPLRVRELAGGFRLTLVVPVLAFTMGLAVLRYLSWGLFGVYEPLFFRDSVGAGPDALGWANAIFGLGLVAGSLLARRVLSAGASVRLVLLLGAAAGLGAAGYVAVPDLRAVAVGAAAFGTTVGLLLPAERTLLQSVTPEGYVGRVTGVLTMAESAGDLLPSLVVAAFALSGDPRLVLLAAGLTGAVVAVACLPLSARLDRTGRVRRSAGAGDPVR